jgi:uncharacterized repeat protein (TIGR04076 family)
MKKWPKVTAEIVKIIGNLPCEYRHRVGQKFNFSIKGCNKPICTLAYSALKPAVDVLLHGGNFSWAKNSNDILWGCPHPGKGQVIFRLKRKK